MSDKHKEDSTRHVATKYRLVGIQSVTGSPRVVGPVTALIILQLCYCRSSRDFCLLVIKVEQRIARFIFVDVVPDKANTHSGLISYVPSGA